MKKTYKPKAKNETALKKYIKNATKKSNNGHGRSPIGKR
jgi:hypothetical protein